MDIVAAPDIVAALQRFQKGELPPASLLRLLLQHEQWWVPLGEGDAPELRSDGERSWLTAYPEEIEGPAALFTGSELVCVPSEGTGVILDPEAEHAVSFDASKLAELRRWATALRVEAALAAPGSGQRELLLSARWLTLQGAQGLPVAVRRADLLLVPLFTAEDVVARFLSTEPVLARGVSLGYADGADLFRALAARTDHDGLLFCGPPTEVAPVGPSFAGDLLGGLDSRPGASVLPSRTVAEIHLWLDLASVPKEDRHHVIEEREQGLCAVYEVPLQGSGQGKDRARVPFALGATTADPLDLGEGPSQILCGGLLADALRTRMLGLPEGRLTPEDRTHAETATRLAWELEKLHGEGRLLPRRAVRTALGARLLRERPELATREFVVAQRQRAEALAGTV